MRCGLPYNDRFKAGDTIIFAGRTYLILEVLDEEDQYRMQEVGQAEIKLYCIEVVDCATTVKV